MKNIFSILKILALFADIKEKILSAEFHRIILFLFTKSKRNKSSPLSYSKTFPKFQLNLSIYLHLKRNFITLKSEIFKNVNK